VADNIWSKGISRLPLFIKSRIKSGDHSPEKKYFLAGSDVSPSVIKLNKIQEWVYSDSQILRFQSLNPPYVVNGGIKNKASKDTIKFVVRIWPYASESHIPPRNIKRMKGIQGFILKETREYFINVESAGCEWWVMVGHENEGYRQ